MATDDDYMDMSDDGYVSGEERRRLGNFEIAKSYLDSRLGSPEPEPESDVVSRERGGGHARGDKN